MLSMSPLKELLNPLNLLIYFIKGAILNLFMSQAKHQFKEIHKVTLVQNKVQKLIKDKMSLNNNKVILYSFLKLATVQQDKS